MPWRPGKGGTVCRGCGRHVDECGTLSARGKCGECGTSRHIASVIDMSTHSGHYFQQWRRGMAASVGCVLPDDTGERV